MKQTLYEKQSIDYTTGEITSITTVKASTFSEEFFMARKTDALDWIYELSGTEIKIIIFLLNLEDLPRGENKTDKVLMRLITLGKINRDALLQVLDCSSSYLARTFKRLEDKEWLLRLNKTDFLLNPKGFYQGSSKDVWPRIVEFERLWKAEQAAKKIKKDEKDKT